MTFNPDLPVQTRDGRKARIICTDMKGSGMKSVAALVFDSESCELPRYYYANGRTYDDGPDAQGDLINIPEKRWAVLFRDNSWAAFDDEEAARQLVRINDRALASLEFTEGQGL